MYDGAGPSTKQRFPGTTRSTQAFQPPLTAIVIFIQALAWTKIALAVVAGTCAAVHSCTIQDDPVLYGSRALQVLLYAATAAFLLIPSRKPAASALGLVLLMVATSFAQGVVMRTGIWSEPGSVWALLLSVRADAFLPFATFLFATRFPELQTRAPTLSRVATFTTWAALALGAALLAANLSTQRLIISEWRSAYQVVTPHYWSIVLISTLAALVLLLLKARFATAPERARLRLLMTHLVVVASGVASYVVVSELSTGFRTALANDGLDRLLMPLLQLLMLSLPLVATYALLVERAAGETMRVRNVVGYRLASTTLGVGAAVPFVLVAWYLWNLRTHTIGEAFRGANLVALSASVLLGFLLFRMRAAAQVAVDRAFLRRNYDKSSVLSDLHDRIAGAANPDEFAAHVCAVVEDHLGFAKVAVMVPSETAGATVEEASLVRVPVSQFASAVNDATTTTSPPVPWLVPIKGADGAVIALLRISAKRGDAPVTSQDRDFVPTLARQAARPLAQLLGKQQTDEPAGLECPECGAVSEASASACGTCNSIDLEKSHLPKRLQQRFTVIRRVGSGSMGVVYEAVDDTLGRHVALKTLPRVGQEHFAQLREEARAMARVSHPNVATVYQFETWRGLPVIVMEFFEHGTFARQPSVPVTLDALKGIGSGLADGLAYLHRLGLVHADVKPSNLGIGGSGFAKIMDFGLTRFLTQQRVANAGAPAPSTPMQSHFAGTPAYLAPELARGAQPNPGSDLWALALSLFEIYTGVNPFRRTTLEETMRAILREQLPPASKFRPDASPAIAGFFAVCLARTPAERPPDADAFRRRLLDV